MNSVSTHTHTANPPQDFSYEKENKFSLKTLIFYDDLNMF